MKRMLFTSLTALTILAVAFFVAPSSNADGLTKSKAAVTFNKDVAPILFKNCAECHRPGEAAPMSLLSYKNAELTPPPTSDHETQIDFGKLEEVILAELKETNTPGAAIGIVKGDKLIFAKGFGVSNIETGAPVTPEMLFRLASITKMFTAAALVTLVEKGKLKLDEPIGKMDGFGTEIIMAPDHRVAVIILANKSFAKLPKSLEKAMELTLPLEAKANENSKTLPLADSEVGRYVGCYGFTETIFEVLFDDGKLLLKREGESMPMSKISDSCFDNGAFKMRQGNRLEKQIGVKDRRYLDRTGLARHRSINKLTPVE